MRDFIVRQTQHLYWALMLVPFHFFLHFQVKNPSSLDLSNISGPTLIVSNHTSWLDPFFIGSAFPLRSKVFPYYSATWHIYYWVFLVIVWPLGAFPVKKGGILSSLLKYPLEVLQKGGVVAIFPEGKRYYRGRRRKPRRGAAFLAMETNTTILPIYIQGATNLSLLSFLLRKKQVRVHIGRQFHLPSEFTNSEDIEQLTEASQFIAEKIQGLREQAIKA